MNAILAIGEMLVKIDVDRARAEGRPVRIPFLHFSQGTPVVFAGDDTDTAFKNLFSDQFDRKLHCGVLIPQPFEEAVRKTLEGSYGYIIGAKRDATTGAAPGEPA